MCCCSFFFWCSCPTGNERKKPGLRGVALGFGSSCRRSPWSRRDPKRRARVGQNATRKQKRPLCSRQTKRQLVLMVRMAFETNLAAFLRPRNVAALALLVGTCSFHPHRCRRFTRFAVACSNRVLGVSTGLGRCVCVCVCVCLVCCSWLFLL